MYYLNANEIMILITRPLPQATFTKAKLQALGHAARIYPLLKIEFCDFDLVDAFDYVILTSQNAAKALCTKPAIHAQALVVGDKTSALIDQHGYKVAFTAPDAEHLYNEISLNISKNASILYLSGNHLAFPLVQMLGQAGYKVTRKVVYNAKAIDHLPPLHDIGTILFYSPRTASIFRNNAQVYSYNIQAICISQNTARQLEGVKFSSLKIASAPNEESMLELINER